MGSSQSSFFEIAKLFLSFFSENLWAAIFIVFLIVCKDAISNLIKRVTNLRFKKGTTELGIEASSIGLSQESDTLLLEEEPVSKDFKDLELAEKEDKKSVWFTNMHLAFLEGRIDDAKNFFKKYSEKEENEEEREENETFYLYLLFTKGKDSNAIIRLEKLVQNIGSEKTRLNGLIWLSFCFHDLSDYGKEINLWQNAIQDIKDGYLKTQCFEYLSYALKSDGRSKEALSLLESRLLGVSSEEEKIILFRAIAAIEKDLGNDLMYALCKEKIVELRPDDRDNLFDAAYFESEAKLRSLSICNYRTLLKLNPNHSMALNNIGVCADEYELNTIANEYYTQAKNLGNTLAMANLGYKLLNSGFYEKAEEIAKDALKKEEPHEKIYSLLSKAKATKKKHSDKWTSIEKKARVLKKSMRRYVDAYYSGQDSEKLFIGTWFTENSIEIDVSLDVRRVKTEWVEGSFGFFPIRTEYKVTLSGTIKNESASIRYTKKRSDSKEHTTLLTASSTNDIDCLSYINSAKSSWHIFSKSIDDDFTLTLYRVAPNKANATDS